MVELEEDEEGDEKLNTELDVDDDDGDMDGTRGEAPLLLVVLMLADGLGEAMGDTGAGCENPNACVAMLRT